MTPSLETRDLTVRFGGHVAVNAVSCAFHPGQLTAIVGPNGAGKTTWFNLISGQIRATSGQVRLEGRDISSLSPSARAHAGLGRAFQLTNLFPALSVFENIRLTVQSRRKAGLSLFRMADSRKDLILETEEILTRTRLTAQARAEVRTLPHGDQRKVEVALLLALRPKIFMFDEPTAGMSMDEAPVILSLIADIRKDPAATVLLVEHKMDVIRALADRIVVLHNGTLVADGPPGRVMASDVVREAYMGREIEDV
ncbi:ABC transporter ATP-binding protein [Falsigemmobacter intermedius]|uniref:ABC transporter ATP-binding protein n=1 Tax=Falsigemmobacter intermedius TaxID=1553448 RepID=UPI003F113B0B